MALSGVRWGRLKWCEGDRRAHTVGVEWVILHIRMSCSGVRGIHPTPTMLGLQGWDWRRFVRLFLGAAEPKLVDTLQLIDCAVLCWSSSPRWSEVRLRIEVKWFSKKFFCWISCIFDLFVHCPYNGGNCASWDLSLFHYIWESRILFTSNSSKCLLAAFRHNHEKNHKKGVARHN